MDIIVSDINFTSLGVIDIFQSLLWIDKYDDVGTFELYLRMTPENVALVSESNILSIKESDQKMMVDSVKILSDIENGDQLVVMGRSLTSILERRIIWNQLSLSGDFQTAIQSLLDHNIISPVTPEREISNFIFSTSTDPAVTDAPDIDEQFYGHNLLNVIQMLCHVRNIGFKVLLDNANQFVFSLYSGVDRSFAQTVNPHVIFSPDFDNLISSDYVETAVGSATVTLVLGEGAGYTKKRRVVASPGGAGSGIIRRESFTDANDISYTVEAGTLTDAEYQALLQARGEETLAQQGILSQFDATVDDSIGGFMYGRDFFLGDIVQAKNEYGIAGAMRVSEFVISEDISGHTIYPTFRAI